MRAVRSIANNYTLFALESFIDEMALEFGRDPLEFRLSMLKALGHNAGPDADHIEKSHSPKWLNYSAYQKSSAIGGAKRRANVLRIASGVANYGSKVLPENTAQGIAISGAERSEERRFGHACRSSCSPCHYYQPRWREIGRSRRDRALQLPM